MAEPDYPAATKGEANSPSAASHSWGARTKTRFLVFWMVASSEWTPAIDR